MNGLLSSFRFADGRLVKFSPPQWYSMRPRIRRIGRKALRRQAQPSLHSWAADGLEIYQAADGSYFILYWELQKCIAEIFVEILPTICCFALITLRRSRA